MISKTRVIHVNEMGDNFDAVYIGRKFRNKRHNLPQSDWQNPFPLKQYSRAESLRRYVRHAKKHELHRRIGEIAGKPLACWCRKDGQAATANTMCHGDILAAVANDYAESGVQRWDAAEALLEMYDGEAEQEAK